MAGNDGRKVNKIPKRLSRDIIAIIIAFALIGVYIFYECYVVTHIDVETITAVTNTVYETIDTRALVVRDEHIIENASQDVTVACVSDGEKVKVGGDIALSFLSAENAKKYSELKSLHSELDYYLDMQSRSAGVATDVESIDKDILEDVNSYVRAQADYSADALGDCAENLNDKLTRRQMIIGEKIDFSVVTKNLEDKINKINTDSCEPTGHVTTDRSGIFSSYTDGCEGFFDYAHIENIDIKTLDDYFSKVEKAQKKECLGKLITNYEWYFCCRVTADQIKNIDDGDKLQVALKDSDAVIDCEVLKGADVDLGTKESVLILRSSQMDSALASLRVEDIEIRYGEYSGFKVPASAIHMDENDNKGVYAMIANQVVFRYGKIIYQTKDYAIFAYEPNEEKSIRLYDQIIIKGKELHDGKVYT